MKRVSDYARGIRQLYHTLLRRHGRPRIPTLRDPTVELMYAVLARWGPEARAASTVDHLLRSAIDLNDLRVTPVVELTEMLRPAFKQPREAAESLSRVLNGVFNRRYTLDLSFLKSMNRRDVARMLAAIPGSHPHDVALFMLRNHRLRLVPITPDCLAYLRQAGLVDPNWSHSHVQTFLQRVIPASGAEAFCYLLKRHVAANPLPPPAEAAPTVAAGASQPLPGGSGSPPRAAANGARPARAKSRPNRSPRPRRSRPRRRPVRPRRKSRASSRR
jgi:hypothetical protein